MSQNTARIAQYPIDPLFLQRWSPRAFTGEPMAENELMSLLEAARWAPSSGNSQPWRFVWARRDTEHWPRLFELLAEGNRVWAHRAAALIFILSTRTATRPGRPEPKPLYSHSFDTGAAWAMLALQAQIGGWHAHGMIGLDFERAIDVLAIPDDWRLEAAVAVGRRGDKSMLGPELREREAPNGRENLQSLAFEGHCPSQPRS